MADVKPFNGDVLGKLFTAVTNGNLADVKQILEPTFPAQVFQNISPSLIHQAANNQRCQVLNYLLQKGAFVDSINANSMTPLHIAANKGDARMLRMLLMNNANVNAVDYDYRTALYFAAYDGYIDCVKIILKEEKLDIGITRKGGYTPLHEVARFGYLDCMEALIKSGMKTSGKTIDADWTPGHMAAASGQLECLRFLIEQGIDVNAGGGPNRTSTLLHEAAHFGHLDCINLLLESGADPLMYDRNSLPHHLASRDGHPDCLDAFCLHLKKIGKAQIIDAFTSVDPRTNSLTYHNALHMASLYGRSDCVKVLLRHNAQHLLNGIQQSPLMLATMKFHTDCIKILLKDIAERGLDNKSESNKYTALHFLCMKTYDTTEKTIACACLLINSGVDVNSYNIDWVIPPCLQFAAKNGAVGLVRFLLLSGASPWQCEKLETYRLNVANVKACADIIAEAKSEPKSLEHCCRIRIRKLLIKNSSIYNVYELPLPNSMMQYILHGHFSNNELCQIF